MAILTIPQARQYAAAAGFTGTALDTIVAIAQAESGLNTLAVNPRDPAGGSFGIVQINGVHFGGSFTQAQAFDPAAAFRFAYTLSDGGTNFSAWSTYTSGAYKTTAAWKQSESATSTAQTAAANAARGILWGPAQSLKAWPWLTKDGVTINNTNQWDGVNEKGVDIGTPFHTTITSLTSGHVIRTFYGTDINPTYQYGGVVLVGSTIPGHPGMQAVYYLHLDEISVKAGDTLQVGQPLGLSGGQNTGGQHPVSTTFSSGAHSEVGINNPDFAAEGGAPGPNFDPLPWLNSLVKKGPPVADQVATAAAAAGIAQVGLSTAYTQALSNQLASGTGPVGDDFADIESRIDTALQFVPIDWQTITSGVHWWQVFLPWTWADAVNKAETNLANAVYHDVGAFMLRFTIVLIGLIVLIAFLFGVVSATAKATGADKVAGAAAKLGTDAAIAGAV